MKILKLPNLRYNDPQNILVIRSMYIQSICYLKRVQIRLNCILWPWFLVMWQEYHVFGSTRAGESPEEGKEENTEKVRLTIITFLLSIWRTLKSESTFTILYTKAPIVVITFGAYNYTSGRIDTILKE